MEKKQAVREAKKGTSPAADGVAGEHDDPVAVAHPDGQGKGAPKEAAGADAEGHASGLIFPLSYPVDLAGLRESLPFLREHGLNAEVDLSDTTYNGEVAIRDLERLAIELRRNKTKVIARLPHHDLKLASHDKMILQHSMEAIQEGLEIGKILGARIAIFHSGFSNHVRPDEIDWWVEQSVTSLRDLVARAKEEEVIVALRNTWESDEQVLARLFEAVDSPWFRFCCDVGHAACFSQFAPEDWIVQFRERLVNLHFHDNDGISDLHQVCGKGVVGFDVIYETIREQLSEPVNITLQVSREDLEPSIQHLESCGFHFDRSR
ncbi:MAG: sugar phosphate isomerase/epimerase [Candidatus Eisenbacteria bacterium]|nr:sugar phosphate isomerase/epimerase [Candidatus Eisenbacteria bacterium]